MGKAFKKAGNITLALILLISFSGVILEQDFCLPCGTVSEEIHFLGVMNMGNGENCCCHTESSQTHTPFDKDCCSTTHKDFFKITFKQLKTDFITQSVKKISKPFIFLVQVIYHYLFSTKANSLITEGYPLLAESSPPILSQAILCVFRN